MRISPVAHMVALAVMQFTMNIGAIARWLTLRRHERNSIAARVSDILYYSAVVTAILQSVACFYRLVQVKRVYDHAFPIEIPFMLQDKKILLPLFMESVGYSFDIYCIRGAFVAMYYDLLPHLDKRIRYALHVLAAMCVVFFIITFLLTLLWCRPISSIWDAGLKSCFVLTNLPIVNIITWTSVVVDVMLLAIATIILKSLRLRGSDFWALGFVYLIGVISASAELVRYAVLYNYLRNITGADPNTSDLVEFWTTTEVFLGNLAFVLPTFRTVARTAIGKLVSATTTPKDGYPNSHSHRSAGRRKISTMISTLATRATHDMEEDEIGLQEVDSVQVQHSFEASSASASSLEHGIDHPGSVKS